MSRLASLWQNVVQRGRVEKDLDDELRTLFELLVDDKMRAGMSPEEARRTATLELGRVDVLKEQVREAKAGAFADALLQDVHYGLRTLRKSPTFALAAIATLAIGIGANTAVFSVVDALLLRTLPVKNAEELVVFDWLRTSDSMVARHLGYGRLGPVPGLGIRTSFSALTVERFRAHSATLSDVFAFSPTGTLNVVTDRQADTASGLFVTGSYFAGLGVPALVGRTLSASDDRPQAEPVAVISHRYWRRRFASDRGSSVRPSMSIGHLS